MDNETNRQFSQEQLNFIAAKALYDTAKKQRLEELQKTLRERGFIVGNEYRANLTRREIDEIVEIEVGLEEKYNDEQLYQTYTNAASELIEWLIGKLKDGLGDEEIKLLREDGWKIVYRERLTNIAMGLEA